MNQISNPLGIPDDSIRSEFDLAAYSQDFWAVLEQVKASVLFEAPIAHFCLPAFQSKGIDEHLAQITATEAALESKTGYGKNIENTTGKFENRQSLCTFVRASWRLQIHSQLQNALRLKE